MPGVHPHIQPLLCWGSTTPAHSSPCYVPLNLSSSDTVGSTGTSLRAVGWLRSEPGSLARVCPLGPAVLPHVRAATTASLALELPGVEGMGPSGGDVGGERGGELTFQ